MLGLIQTALWPFPQEDYAPSQRLLRSVGKRLTACAAALDESYRVPSREELRRAHGAEGERAKNKNAEQQAQNPLFAPLVKTLAGHVCFQPINCSNHQTFSRGTPLSEPEASPDNFQLEIFPPVSRDIPADR